MAAAVAGSRPAPYRIVPGPFVKKPPPEADGAVPSASRFSLGGLTVQIELVGDRPRAEFIRSIDGRSGDPFAASPGAPPRFHTFRVLFDNRTAESVVFQPGNVVLVTDRAEQQFAIDITDVYMQAARSGRADPDAAVARVAPLIFDSSTTIPPNQRLEKLLVFGPLPERWKEFRLHFSFLQIGTETHTVSFLFHRRPVKG